ncbi:EF-hand domain-containing protein [Longispora urticae]
MSDAQPLSPAQTEEYRKAFTLHDRNNSGYITSDELGVVLRSLGARPTAIELRKLIADADANGNKRLDLAEFLALMAAHGGPSDAELAEAFRAHDADGDGYVTAEEMTRLMVSMGDQPTTEEVAAAFTAADGDGDGRLDYAEFKALYSAS